MDFVSKLGDKVFDFVLDASIRHVGYIINYRGHVEELKQGVEALEKKCERVEHKIVRAKNNVSDIERDSEDLREKARERIKEWEEFQNDEAHTKTGCSRGILPFLWYRHKLGRKAKRMAMNVQSVSDQMPKVDEVSYQQNPRADTDLYNAGYVEFESRKKTMEDIMKQLADPMVSRIGVYGPGGVGKTTLVKEIAKRARDSKSFDKVVKVIITANPNLEKIQDEIAYHFGLNFEGESENGRAVLLRKRLKQENGNILVILDDLWDGLDLSVLGISFDDEDLGHTNVKDRKDADHKMVKNEDSQVAYKGCKILLTSRSKEVLSNKLNVKENLIFHVEELGSDEAKTLFEKVADTSDKHSKFIPEIVKCCARLPMVILTVEKALRNKSELVWEDAREKLKRQELMEVRNYMKISLRLSYDQLESEELKSIFLLCAQMGHRPLIWDLVKYCFGLGILEGVHTLRDARVRVSESIQKIRYSSLLLDVSSSDHFNMHDLVRDPALSIAHKDRNVFTLRNGKLEDWPDEIERCTVISIYKSDIVDALPEVMNCPQLRVFHIDSDDPNLKIPDRLFEVMEKLKVLILIGINLGSLPSSIKRLSNLRMLCLERCVLGNFSIIRELKKLRILSLSGSVIEEWPAELEHWSKLQLLDISDCSIRNMIPLNFISSLTNLEELYIRKSLIDMMLEGESNRSQISVLSELKHLHQLKVVDVCFPSSDVFPTDLFFDKLDDYKIVIGYFKTLSIRDFKMPSKYEASRSLALQLNFGTDIHSLKGVKMLFKRVENLLLGELNGVQNAFDELNLDGFPNLKSLSIINNIDIKYIVNSMVFSNPQVAFPNLDSLCLLKLMNLESICCSPVTNTSFSSLKTIKVKMCTKLKNIFSFHIVELLTSLEAIDICECDHLKVIIVDDAEVSNKVVFHKLCSLTLQKLPLCISFFANNQMLSEAQYMDRQERSTKHIEGVTSISLFGEKVEIPNLEILKLSSINIHMIWSDKLSNFWFRNLTKLIIEDCDKLTYLCSLSVANGMEKLKGLFVRRCNMMEKLFMIGDGDSNKSSKVCMFPKLEEIELFDMDMLKEIWPGDEVWRDPEGAANITNLQRIKLERCPSLRKGMPVSVAKCLGKLEELTVCSCYGMDEIVDAGSETSDDPLKFPTLTRLQFSFLLKIKCFCKGRRIVENPNLKHLKVFGCGELLFTRESRNEGRFAFSAEKVIPNLSNLSLGEKELKMICQGHQRNPLHKIKVLDLRGFNVESDELPHGFLQKLPNIEKLVVSDSSFNEIRDLVPSLPCFSTLIRISISNCNDMAYLFTSSTAKSLTQLKKMDISSCRSIQEIVSNKEDESHHDDEIIFEQLEKLKLNDLPNLESFYKGNFTLSFPSLREMSVNKCCRMDKFCVGTINANNLSAIYSNEKRTPLDVDLNCSINKAFKDQLAKFVKGVKDLKLVDKPEVHQIWHGSFPVPFLCFFSLKSLIMERCEFLSTAIPSHILGLLPILEELEVRQCRSVKTIFGVKDIVKGKMKLNEGPAFSPPFRLKKLTFEQLPNLENVWDSDPQEVIGLQNLQEVYVNLCDRLERLFPASLAKSLMKLEKLEVQECSRLVEIVAENKAVAEGAPKEFVMPCMTSIKLWSLPELKCFYPEPHNLKCPNVKEVYLFHCDKLQTFTCESQIIPEYQAGIPQPLFLAEKVIPYLEFLAMSKEMAMLDGNLLYKLQAIQLQCFHDDSDTFPYELLRKVPYIEKLGVSCSSFREIFCSERPNADCDEFFSHLKCLQLSSLSKLNSIGFEHFWVNQISENLETLQIDQCHSLRNIVRFTTSFSNLIDLNLSQCDGLVYLFTPSTCRTLSQLKNMSIEKCESLEEIVHGEAKEEEEEIIFNKLETLFLQSLPKLGSFYNGSVALSFPSLDKLSVIKCPEMESFSAGAVTVNVNRWIGFKFKENESAILLKDYLNSAIRKTFERKFF